MKIINKDSGNENDGSGSNNDERIILKIFQYYHKICTESLPLSQTVFSRSNSYCCFELALARLL